MKEDNACNLVNKLSQTGWLIKVFNQNQANQGEAKNQPIEVDLPDFHQISSQNALDELATRDQLTHKLLVENDVTDFVRDDA